MCRSQVTRTWVEKIVLPKLSKLSRADADILRRVLECFGEQDSKASYGMVLEKEFGGLEEADQARLRAFRSRLADALPGSGFSLKADSRKKTDPYDRELWWEVHTRFLETQHLSALTGLLPPLDEGQYVKQRAWTQTDGKYDIETVFVAANKEADALIEALEEQFGASKGFQYSTFTTYNPGIGLSTEEIEARIQKAQLVIALVSPALLRNEEAMGRIALAQQRGKLCIYLQLKTTGSRNDHGCIPTNEVIWQGTAWSANPTRRHEQLLEAVREIETRIEDFIKSGRLSTSANAAVARPHLPEESEHYEPPNGIPFWQVPDVQDLLKLGSAEQGQDAFKVLEDWANNPDSARYMAVLGEYGIGKTTLLQHFTRSRLQTAKIATATPLTVYLDLRYAVKKSPNGEAPELSQILQSVLRRSWQSSEAAAVTPDQILRWVQQEGATLIFDGLDEVLVHLSVTEGQAFLRELWRALPPSLLKEENTRMKAGRLIFSCRSSYFATVREQASTLVGQDRESLGRESYHALILLPFREEQIRSYLSKVLGEDRVEAALATIRSVHNLSELSARPYLLSLIAPDIGRLESLRADGRTVSSVDLYEGFVERWLLRDMGKHTLAPEDKRVLMEDLAHAMWAANAREWRWSELRTWLLKRVAQDEILKSIHLSRPDSAQVLEQDFRTSTFVLRPDSSEDGFRFAHTSLQEFFLAKALVRALQQGNAEAWCIGRPSDETFQFVGELLVKESGWEAGLNALLELRTPGGGENALAYWIIAHRAELPEPSPTRIDLHGADLFGRRVVGSADRPLRLRGAVFDGADVRTVEFAHVDLTHASFRNAQGYGALFVECQTRDADFEGFDGTGTVWRGGENPITATASAIWSGAVTERAEAAERQTPERFGHSRSVTACAFSPGGEHIVSASWDHTLILWDAATGKPLRTLKGHKRWVNACTFSPGGQQVVSASWDNTLILWDAATGKPLRTLEGHTHWVTGCAFSPSGEQIVSASSDGTLILWDAATGKPLRTLEGHTDLVTTCGFSPGGKHIVSASEDKTLILWETATGKPLRTLEGHTGSVFACAFSPGGEHIVSASSDGTLFLWEAATGKPFRTLEGHTHWVTACAFSPGGKHIVSASHDKTLILWDAATGEPLRTLEGHTDLVTACAFSPGGKHIVSASHDKTLILWDAATGEPLRTLKGHTNWVSACAFSPGGKHIVSASEDKTLILWETATGKPLRTLEGHTGSVFACAFSPGGEHIVSASSDGTLFLWEAATGKPFRTLEGHTHWVTACAFSPGGKHIVSASSDKTLILWDAATGKPLRTLEGHKRSVFACAFSPGGEHIVSASWDGTLILWDAATGEPLRTLEGHTDLVTACAFSPGGKHIVSASRDGTLILWDTATGKPLRTLEGHTGSVFACAFSPGGKHIVSGSEDNTLILWDVSTGKPLRTLEGHTGSVFACAFSPGGKHIVSASWDGTLVLWDAASGKPLKRHYHLPVEARAVEDIATRKFTYLEPDSWRYLHAVGTDPETGRRIALFPEAALAPEGG
jgi:WD40 repeat protein/uncharacterized protein YjbI with pentapeptide repeats